MNRMVRSNWGTAAIIGLVALFAFVAVQLPEQTAAIAQSPAKKELPIELQYVPVDAALFLSVDALQVWDHPILKAFRKADPRTFDELTDAAKMSFGLSPGDVASLVAFMPKIQIGDNHDGVGVVITFRKAYDKVKLAHGVETLLPKNSKIKVVALTDRKALVLINLDDEFAKPQPADKTGPLTTALHNAASGKRTCVVALTPSNLPEILRGEDVPAQIRPFQPLLKATAITTSFNLGKSLDLNVQVKTGTAGQAAECERALGTLMGLIQEELSEELKTVETDAVKDPSLKDLVTTMKAASTAIKNAKYSTLGNETGLTVSLEADLPFSSAYFAAKERIESAKAVITTTNNLMQIALATINYADSMNGNLPPAAICDKTGKPLLSWRVLILPYMEQEALFKEFKLDEPWDSDHNKKLLAKMPKVYAIPGKNKLGDTDTYFRVFVGNGAGFDWIKGARFPADIPDGTSQTLMCVTARDSVPWTKPEELEFDPDKDMRNLLGTVNGKMMCAMFDGSSHTFKKIPSKETIHALITPAGGEVIGDDFE
ncbi:MAG TPA: DUF1559 domain-containing protein [Gemmata sp.]|nr:DUF1559 domain-containing protein [Gemmata sp.]